MTADARPVVCFVCTGNAARSVMARRMFAELAPDAWTLVFSTLGAKQSFQEETPNAVWGGYGYTDDLDVLRASMTVAEHPVSADQLIVTFTDMTQQGGNLTIWFEHKIATIPFRAR